MTNTPTDEPIEVGNVYRQPEADVDHDAVEIMDIWIDERGFTQVRVLDVMPKTLTGSEIYERVSDGRLVLEADAEETDE